MPEISTKRLKLRTATGSDVDAFHRILSDERATAYWSTPPHTDIAQTQQWVASMMAIAPGQGEDFVIELDGQVIGKAGIYRFPEIGFILHPDAWGKGYAQEALRPVLKRAFDVHDLSTVEADVDPRNEASLRLLKHLGFEEVGRADRTWKIGGEWCASVYLRLRGPPPCSGED